ncbi:hypothetical protein Mame01_62480 [Microbispora amethystogenes]|nr:hypothetical protein Mame01_62480 [Microbispora amethystogenes]
MLAESLHALDGPGVVRRRVEPALGADGPDHAPGERLVLLACVTMDQMPFRHALALPAPPPKSPRVVPPESGGGGWRVTSASGIPRE